jgi:hypothetical protein
VTDTMDRVTENIDPMQLDPIPSALPEDTRYLGDRLDKMIALLTDIQQAEVGDQTPTPGLFFIQTGRNDFPQTTRIRTTDFIVSVSAACTVTLVIGSATFYAFDLGAAGTLVLPCPTLIDAGKDVTVSVSAGVLRMAAILGHPETTRP